MAKFSAMFISYFQICFSWKWIPHTFYNAVLEPVFWSPENMNARHCALMIKMRNDTVSAGRHDVASESLPQHYHILPNASENITAPAHQQTITQTEDAGKYRKSEVMEKKQKVEHGTMLFYGRYVD
ncbi:unnamed protein product [Acanthoscelides obtectus]|uniref:Uncharacterized protein n=1 Tax=Acanthoscelides obtectus TaxID=200917 RepID=A0A9P0KRJ7_ACAOB|nr:unnamed protein product [Acanthoscelides obtectus]CAK1645681.1 hypothetical protein AOBTE_LOCUS14206 [Acanthoscelides obtectus]